MSRALRLVALVLLLALAFVLGIDAGSRQEPEPAVQVTESPVFGPALWESLDPALLANVAEGIMEEISDLQDDLAQVQAIQREKMSREITG